VVMDLGSIVKSITTISQVWEAPDYCTARTLEKSPWHTFIWYVNYEILRISVCRKTAECSLTDMVYTNSSEEEFLLPSLTLNLPTTTIVAQPFLMFCWPCIIVMCFLLSKLHVSIPLTGHHQGCIERCLYNLYADIWCNTTLLKLPLL
jgi:hypothetical protein